MKKYILTALTFLPLMAQSVKCQTIDTLIDVGGYRLYFHIIKGKGMPILFEGGAGAASAIVNYKRSLELNPKSRHSIERMKVLQGQ